MYRGKKKKISLRQVLLIYLFKIFFKIFEHHETGRNAEGRVERILWGGR